MADLTPTEAMASAAKRGLRLHDQGKSGDGLKPETVRRANIIARRDELTESHVREMRAWFARHKANKRPGWDDAGDETPAFVAWLLWGASPEWAERKVEEMDREQEDRSVERRSLAEGLEVREIDGEVRIVGYAALYNSESHVLAGGFREVIRPGAFDDALADPSTDVVALFNHDENYILGRQSSGTLQLAADERGLRYSVALPRARADVAEAVRRGDVKGSSFAFVVNADGEEYQRSEDGGPPLRYINRVTGLYDVSAVLHPAYPATTAAVRKRAAEFAEPIAEQAEPAPIRVSPLAQAEHVARWLRRSV